MISSISKQTPSFRLRMKNERQLTITSMFVIGKLMSKNLKRLHLEIHKFWRHLAGFMFSWTPSSTTSISILFSPSWSPCWPNPRWSGPPFSTSSPTAKSQEIHFDNSEVLARDQQRTQTLRNEADLSTKGHDGTMDDVSHISSLGSVLLSSILYAYLQTHSVIDAMLLGAYGLRENSLVLVLRCLVIILSELLDWDLVVTESKLSKL